MTTYNLRSAKKKYNCNLLNFNNTDKKIQLQENYSEKALIYSTNKNSFKMTETMTVSLETVLSALPQYNNESLIDFEQFLNTFNEAIESTKLADSSKILLLNSKITGRTREKILMDDDLTNEKVYANLIIKLKTKFKPSINFLKAQLEFMSLKQTPTQTVEEFAQKVQKKSADFLKGSGHEAKEGAKDFVDDLKFNKFLDGLRPDLALEVRKSEITDFDAAVKRAKIIEQAHNFQNEQVNAVNHTSPQATEDIYTFLMNTQFKQMEEIKKIQEQLQNLSVVKQTEIENSKIKEKETNIFCHICKTSSHMTEACWHNARNNPQISDVAHNKRDNMQMHHAYPPPINYDYAPNYYHQGQNNGHIPKYHNASNDREKYQNAQTSYDSGNNTRNDGGNHYYSDRQNRGRFRGNGRANGRYQRGNRGKK